MPPTRLRLIIPIFALLLGGCFPRAASPTPRPFPTPTAVLTGTPMVIEDHSVVGPTDGIVLMGAIITALIVLVALVRHQLWLDGKEQEEEEDEGPLLG